MHQLSDRIRAAWQVTGSTFGASMGRVASLFWFGVLRSVVRLGQRLDPIVFPRLRTTRVSRPIVLVGNPRTGTTLLHRFLAEQRFGAGTELWRMLYPSLLLQSAVRPVLPLLSWLSPARHHSTVAHETGLTQIETDDVSVFFHHFDGLFLYGFVLAFQDDDPRHWFDPSHRDTSARDFAFLDELWKRSMVAHGVDRPVAKLFSLSTRLPQFLEAYPDAKVLYMARDPLEVLPSGLSLVTGVLDKRYDFWGLPKAVRSRFLERLYQAFVELLRRFHEDWVAERIPHDRVFIVRYDRMMRDFEGLMTDIADFCELEPTDAQRTAIAEQADRQRNFVSKHSYDLAHFGLTEERIRTDCAFFYDTFLE